MKRSDTGELRYGDGGGKKPCASREIRTGKLNKVRRAGGMVRNRQERGKSELAVGDLPPWERERDFLEAEIEMKEGSRRRELRVMVSVDRAIRM